MRHGSHVHVRRAWVPALACGLAVAGAFAQAAPPAADEWHYRVLAGDTLISLAQRYLRQDAGWHALQERNGVADPRQLVPGTVLRIPLAWLRPDAALGTVVFVRGDARLQRLPSAAVAVTPGTDLLPGDRLRTAADSSLTVRFADGARLMVAPTSEVTVDQLLGRDPGQKRSPGVRIELDRGGTESQVPPRNRPAPAYEIQTPAANLGVRGTDFRARVEPHDGGTRLEVVSGTVAAAPPRARGETRVAAGEGTVARPGEPIAPPRPLLPAPDLGAVAPLVERLPLRLAWAAQPGAAGYHVEVADAGESGLPRVALRVTDPMLRWADLPDGRYRLRVRARDAQGIEGHDGERPFAVNARPEPPFTTQPVDGSRLRGERAGLRWSRSDAAGAYRVQLAATDDFSAPTIDRVVEDAALDLELPHGRYRWRVAAIAAPDDQGPFGDAQGFTLSPPPQAPEAEPPASTPQGMLFRWRAPEPGQRIEFQLARDAAFEQLVVDERDAGAAVLWSRPEPGRFHLRTRAIEDDGYAGPYGAVQQIDVPSEARWWLLLPAALAWWLLL